MCTTLCVPAARCGLPLHSFTPHRQPTPSTPRTRRGSAWMVRTCSVVHGCWRAACSSWRRTQAAAWRCGMRCAVRAPAWMDALDTALRASMHACMLGGRSLRLRHPSAAHRPACTQRWASATTQSHTTQPHKAPCHAMPCHEVPCHVRLNRVSLSVAPSACSACCALPGRAGCVPSVHAHPARAAAAVRCRA